MNSAEEDYFPEKPEPDNYINERSKQNDATLYDAGIKRSLTFYRSQKIENLSERISFLKHCLTEYRQGIRYPYEFYDEYDFDKCISLEINYLQGEANKLNENTFKEFIKYEYNHSLMTDIYVLCIKHQIFNFEFHDFIKRIGTANFCLDEHILLKKKFLGLIYKLSFHMHKDWYPEISKNMGIPKRRFGGLDSVLEKENLLSELEKTFRKYSNKS